MNTWLTSPGGTSAILKRSSELCERSEPTSTTAVKLGLPEPCPEVSCSMMRGSTCGSGRSPAAASVVAAWVRSRSTS